MSRTKPERIVVALYGTCAVSMLAFHVAGFATGSQRLHTLGWYALAAAVAIGLLPLTAFFGFNLIRKLRGPHK